MSLTTEGTPDHRAPVPRARWGQGHYTSPSIGLLMEACCNREGVSVSVMRGTRQPHQLVNLRAVVAVLAAEIFPRVNAATVDEAMLRGSGWTIWARGRHEDRLKLYPDYGPMLIRCRVAARTKIKSFPPAAPSTLDGHPCGVPPE